MFVFALVNVRERLFVCLLVLFMSSLELIRLSKLFANLEQHPAIPTLKRLSFYSKLDCRPVNEKITLVLKGFACNSINADNPLGSPRENIVHQLLQMCSILFVLYGKPPDPHKRTSYQHPEQEISVFIIFDENLISTSDIPYVPEDMEDCDNTIQFFATKQDRADVSFVEFKHIYDINSSSPVKTNFRIFDVPLSAFDASLWDESAKVFTLDPKVDDAYVQKFFTEFVLRKDTCGCEFQSVYLQYLLS